MYTHIIRIDTCIYRYTETDKRTETQINPGTTHLRNAWKCLLADYKLKDIASGKMHAFHETVSSSLWAIASRKETRVGCRHQQRSNHELQMMWEQRHLRLIQCNLLIQGQLLLPRFVRNGVACVAGFLKENNMRWLAIVKAGNSNYTSITFTC